MARPHGILGRSIENRGILSLRCAGEEIRSSLVGTEYLRWRLPTKCFLDCASSGSLKHWSSTMHYMVSLVDLVHAQLLRIPGLKPRQDPSTNPS
ncbi:expressed unknown protein [Ectocarpus siliculosus]|uniref:Uncharacterized protein n=1 Tax=Ectocarpus siliculosus TaxID=2880 RepID=D7G679_ECTSI|nr:expressed unknown protein [Ectocarpus siliculosus]|eukprot:CBJ27474.1 expressed unknown protein [Ectocarpus siliculosus]